MKNAFIEVQKLKFLVLPEDEHSFQVLSDFQDCT